jgi:hypothetical protein
MRGVNKAGSLMYTGFQPIFTKEVLIPYLPLIKSGLCLLHFITIELPADVAVYTFDLSIKNK